MTETSKIEKISQNPTISEIIFFSDLFKKFPRAQKKCLQPYEKSVLARKSMLPKTKKKMKKNEIPEAITGG